VSFPRLVATDLDGTIVRFDGGISARTVNAINGARAKGAIIYFVTGRPPRWLSDVTAAFGVKGVPTTICGNGALVFDIASDTVVYENLLPPEIAIETVQALRGHIVDATFACDLGDDFRREKRYHARWDVDMDEEGVQSIEEAIVSPLLKLLVRCASNALTSDEMLEIAQTEVGSLVEVTHSNPSDSLLEISALGVNKGSTLARMAATHGISAAECVAFGDNPNDVSMLKWSGRSWAVGGAHRDAKAAAKYIAGECDDDGVAQVIEELFGLEPRFN